MNVTLSIPPARRVAELLLVFALGFSAATYGANYFLGVTAAWASGAIGGFMLAVVVGLIREDGLAKAERMIAEAKSAHAAEWEL